jgi:hypothetical protein
MAYADLTPQRKIFLQIPMIHHLAKMVSCHLWTGNREQLEMYTGLLRSIVTQQPKALEIIPEVDRERFLYVVDCFTNNINPTPWKPGPREPVRSVKVDILPDDEAALQKLIAFDNEKLVTICDLIEYPTYVSMEAQAGEGRVDISFMAGRTVHAVELKMKKADHRVVGQIQKYMRHIGSKVHYNLYDHVAGWVVSPDFDPDAARELSEIGVRMVRLSLPACVE